MYITATTNSTASDWDTDTSTMYIRLNGGLAINYSDYDDCTTTASNTSLNWKVLRTSTTSATTTNYGVFDYETGNCTTFGSSGFYNKCYWNESDYVEKTPSERLRAMLAQRMAPAGIVRSSKRPIGHTTDIREIRARETLKRVVGEEKYVKFLKDGYVSVRNPQSRRIYQIFPGHQQTRVYENNQMIQQLCIVLNGDFTPTDSVIVRYLLAINNEEKLWKLANKNPPITVGKQYYIAAKADTRLLPEIFKEFKKKLVA